MKISANNFSLSPIRFIAGTRGSYGIEKLEIDFSEEWNGLAKRVVFYPPRSKAVAVIYPDSPIDIPFEVMKERGKTKYAVIGYRDEKKLFSVSGEIDVLGTLDDTDGATYVPTPNEMAQVMSYMQSAIDIANSVREDADNGLLDGNSWFVGELLRGDTQEIGMHVEGADIDDFYLNRSTFELYKMTDTDVWSYVGSIRGEKGDKGEKGETGAFSMAYFDVLPDSGMLVATFNESVSDLSFGVNEKGYLEVKINE